MLEFHAEMKHVIYQQICVSLLIASTIFLHATVSFASSHCAGAAAGIPYTVAITYDRTLGNRYSLQCHAGSFVVFSSTGLRLNWTSTSEGFSPYLFAGDALIHSTAGDFGDPEGVSNYLWFGTGIQYRHGIVRIFVEISGLVGGDDSRGLGDDWIFPFSPAVAGGFKIQF